MTIHSVVPLYTAVCLSVGSFSHDDCDGGDETL